MNQKPTKVCYVLAYKYPNYVRTAALVDGLEHAQGIEVYTAINSTASVFRYLQTSLRLIKQRIVHRPDVYIFGFRSHESFWIFRLLTIGRPVIFDEFINMQQSLVSEKNIIKKDSFLSKLAYYYVRAIHRCTRVILTDTNLHAKSSSKTYKTPINKYKAIYVGTNEKVFKQPPTLRKKTGIFTVFFYGNIEALHGIDHILKAAEQLQDVDIKFVIVGGKGSPKTIGYISNYIKTNQIKNIEYIEWLPFSDLPKYINAADVCLGGPFGGTAQARSVITGKTFQFLASGAATIVGKIHEEVGFRDKQNCLLVEQDSTDSLTDAIEWAYKHRELLPAMGASAAALYKENFSVEQVSKKLETIIKSL